jgi:Fe/S biogenesis protein NfuA
VTEPETHVVPLVEIRDAARAKILEARASEADPQALALWIEVTGTSGDAYTYDVYFRRLDEAGDEHVVQHDDELPVVVPRADEAKVRGSALDLGPAGMVIHNPNSPADERRAPPAPAGELVHVHPVTAEVVEVIETRINPAIAAHGGFAEVVAVEPPVAYLRMGGGCQGCGLAAVTLSQGIEVAILDAVEEITTVVDVTDHASGTNPYYQAAKK